jgi:hypothetical protein
MIPVSVGLISIASAGQTVKLADAPTGVVLTDQGREGIFLEIGIGELLFNEVETSEGVFTLLSFKGCTRSHNIGEPNLPMVNRLLSIPFDCELKVEVLNSEVEEISLTDLNLTRPLLPVQPSISKSEDPASVPFEYDLSIYQRSGYYSLPPAEGRVLGTMRSLHVGLVSVAPIEYNPTQNMIRVYKSLTVRVSYEHPDWAKTETVWERNYSPFFEPVYSRIANYSRQSAEDRDDLVNYPVKYLIVSDRMFEAQLQPFIEWKTRKGFTVITAYTDKIGFTTGAIKNYIQGVYEAGTPEDPAPSFVLLVGDAQQIPPYDYGAHISDLYFCEFTGDNFPEIYYGRFSAQNPSDLQPQIDKTLEYEQYTMPDPSYLGEVTLISGVDYWYAETHGNGQINYGTNLYFNVAHGIDPHVWLYPASDAPGASDAIIQTVDDGIGFINYTAHCGHSGFSNPSFTTTDINNLTNAHKYLLGIGNCCASNTFGTDYGSPCFGEVWLQAQDKGGVGYIGGSNSTYWDEDYWWGVGYGPVIGSGPTYEQTGLGAYDGIFHDHGEPVSQHYITNDAIIYCGNLAVTESGSYLDDYYWQIYHLMGDPSVMTYMGVPSVNNVSHPDVILMIDTSVTVQADPGSYVGISIDGVLHGAAYVDQSGSVDILITPFGEPGFADIVITAQNREPYVSTIPIITPEGPCLVYDGNEVNDTAGNNNGLIESGESILMGIQLKNVGFDTCYNVQVTLTTEDSFITITDDFESYGSIAGDNGTGFVADGFAFDVYVFCPMGHLITFELAVSGDGEYATTLPFEIMVGERTVVFADDFSFDQGWSGLGGSGEWTIGPATGGSGGDSFGGPDPDVDHTPTGDNGVLGNDLTPGYGGDYNPNLNTTYWITSPIIDCSHNTGVIMKYYRWLGVDSPGSDQTFLEVYDGTSWVTLFTNNDAIDESSWTEEEYDLSAYADENPDFQIRFGIGPTNAVYEYCGWNIDDISLKGYTLLYFCGDIDGNSQGPNVADLTYLVDYLFHYGSPPPIMETANVDGEGGINVVDVIYLVNYLFFEGPEPVCQ